MSNKNKSTFDRWMKNPKIKEQFDKEYKDFLLQELFIAMREGDKRSVRKLAEEIGVSKTVIQDISSGKSNNIKFSNFIKMAKTFGYKLVLEKGNIRIPVEAV